MKSAEWKTYRTRFLIKAKQLSSALSFVDALGRQHCGRKGDYLVESSEGVISIAPRKIFEDIYVAMSGEEINDEVLREPTPLDLKTGLLQIESLDIEEVKLTHKPVVRHQFPVRALGQDQDEVRHSEPARVRRKLPQPSHDRRAPSQPSRLNLM